MKLRYKFHLLLLSIAAFLGACSDDFDLNGNLKPSLTAHYLRPTAVSFENSGYEAFSETFRVESFQTPWEFSDTSEWFKLTPAYGDTSQNVTIDVEENRDAAIARTAIFYLSASSGDWDYSRALSVSQGKAVPRLTTDKTELNFGGGSESRQVKVTANCSWKAESKASWISLEEDAEGGVLNVAVSPNSSEGYRTSSVLINYGEGGSLSISVTQSPSNVEASEYTLRFENEASRTDITIDSDSPWTSGVTRSWISVTPENGDAGKTRVSIEVAPNKSLSERTGHVLIQTGGTERIHIVVIQYGLRIETDRTEITFGSSPESQTLGIKSNTSWAILGKPDWISTSRDSGDGNEDVTLTCGDNPNTTQRNGEIIIGQPGMPLESKVKVIQNGKNLNADVMLLEFTDKAGEAEFNLTADTDWKSTASASWFNSSPDHGKGDARITVAVEENKSTEERTGFLKYEYLDKTSEVTVYQMAKYLTVDSRAFEFDSRGGSHTIELLTNEEWTAELEKDTPWLTLSESSGTGQAQIVVTAGDNPSVNPRSAVVNIECGYAQSVRILISQRPRYLTVSSSSILFFAAGGTSEAVKIETDGELDIRCDADWFAVDRLNGNTFTVLASKNRAKESRKGMVSVSLTDLKEGALEIEIPVIQSGEGSSFVINGFPDDKDWNPSESESMTIKIEGYGPDQDWD